MTDKMFWLLNEDTGEVYSLGLMYAGSYEYATRKLERERLSYRWALLQKASPHGKPEGWSRAASPPCCGAGHQPGGHPMNNLVGAIDKLEDALGHYFADKDVPMDIRTAVANVEMAMIEAGVSPLAVSGIAQRYNA